MKIYLCSRIALDAHPINNKVVNLLRRAGHEVFVPHEQHYNQIVAGTAESVPDEEIYTQDMAAMMTADLCVVVGRVGVDCAFEIGWFQNHGVPTVWFTPPRLEVGRHPMFFRVPRVRNLLGIRKFVDQQDTKQQEAEAYEQRA